MGEIELHLISKKTLDFSLDIFHILANYTTITMSIVCSCATFMLNYPKEYVVCVGLLREGCFLLAKQIISARLEPTKYLLNVQSQFRRVLSLVFSPDFWVANRQTNGEENIADNPVDATVTKRGHGIENLGYKADIYQ